jgi:DNA modification methylase
MPPGKKTSVKESLTVRDGGGLDGIHYQARLVLPGVELYLGDCRDVLPTIAPQTIDLYLADPPYGMGKEADGVLNDNLQAGKLDSFLLECWQAGRPALKENASAYIFGEAESLWRLWYVGGLRNLERMTMRNEIVWNKGINGAPWKEGRSYQPATERALFFMLGEQGFNNNADNYWEGWEPIRSYLERERVKSGLSNAQCNQVCGKQNMTQAAFTKGGFRLISKKDYEKLRAASGGDAFKREYDAFKREYEDLKREYEYLKKAFYATRAYFDNTHQIMSDVWEYPKVLGTERCGHPTPKPVALMARAIKTSCPADGVVLDPFMGSKSTGIACIRTGRKFIGIEQNPSHYAAAVQRIRRELAQGDLFLGQNRGEG